ncbi:MAG: hypothetical protein KAI43_09470 [Candidatus Aureabacteria bacterium]|nr:hypothetical protein [Candidatus Auribacterota bacterium]
MKNKENISNRINRIIRDYKFNVRILYALTGDLMQKYGYPQEIIKINNGYLLRTVKNSDLSSSLLLLSDDFVLNEVLYSSRLLIRIAYDDSNNTVYICQRNHKDLLIHKNISAVFEDPNNKLITFDIKNKKINIIKESKKNLFYPTCIASRNKKIIIYDGANRILIIMDRFGCIEREINLDKNYYIRNIQIDDEHNIYFDSISSNNPFNWNIDNRTENIYKINPLNNINLYYKTNCNGYGGRQLYDFIITSKGLMYTTNKEIIRLDACNKLIYNLLMCSPYFKGMKNARVVSINIDNNNSNELLAVLWSSGKYRILAIDA